MPVPACPQRPALGEVPGPACGMEEEEEEAACDGEEPWLGNSNNNAAPGGRPGPQGVRPPGEGPSYLQRVLLEIVESERTYARDLRGIVEGYLGKIIDAEEPPLRPEQVSALFGNIEDIYELSSNLLQSLESCACDPVAVAVCFVTRSQEFDIYTQYCNNYPNSVAALSECMRSKQQARFFRECQEQMRHALPLGAYLLKPVQRILKYHLLLQEIAKHFERKSGDDYEVVVEAIDTMTCVAWYINDMKRKHEHAIRQQEIQSLLLQWKGPDLTSYGELVLEGTFRVQRARSERAVFLFDKLLLITKRRGDHYVYKNHIPCSSLMLIESTRDSLCFSVAHYKHIKQQYGLQAKSVEEKRVWTHHIKRLILENHHAIVPQKAKEAILEMDLFHPPRLPRYSPERLHRSRSCQPLDQPRHGRRQSEPFQRRDRAETLPDRLWGHAGRRQSEPTKQILRQLGEHGLKHAGSEGTLLEAGEPPQPPRAWAAAGGVVEEEEEEEEEEALGKDSQEEQDGDGDKDGDVTEEPQEEQGTPAGSCEWHREVTATPVSPVSPLRTGELGEGLETPAPPSPPGTPPPGLPDGEGDPEQHPEAGTGEDPRALSSEEEEEEEGHGEGSILPLSVLDQASVIAERFGSSLSRRGSLALEGRSGSTLSLDGPPPESGAPRSPPPSPEPPPGPRRRSLLSTQDLLLLRKIRSYYDNAEHQDAGFSIKRRESLSYIPKGLVRTSVSRINSWPPPEPGSPKTPPEPVSPKTPPEPVSPKTPPEPVSPKTPLEPVPAVDGASPACQENGLEPPAEPLLILEEGDVGTGDPPGVLALGSPPGRPATRVYQLARQYSLRIKSRRRRAGVPLGDSATHTSTPGGTRWGGGDHRHRPPATAPLALTPLSFPPGLPKPPVSPGDAVAPTVASVPRSPPSPSGGGTEPFSWPDVRELRARFGAPRPPPVTRSRSAPEGPGRGGRPAAKERGGGRSRSAEAGVGTPDPRRGGGGGGGGYHHHQQPGGLWVTAQAPLGPGGQRVVVLERLPPPAATEPPAYVQIRSPTTREKICLKAVVERCKAYQASEEYRRRCPPGQGEPPEPPRHGLVRDLRQKFQTLDAAS
ncbi:pleckstrin homology domain-containing family G member 3 isoform X1 [Cygnus olor]|uniref:pleckstrin homology domain-containing family G member 3 isoform X1 n=1 Tax=Cygnus olor TaxID=8869 RepID=UPI001ADE5D83|nr:pleckstrin homology domain-containing family G member 3 isoform X1 [Cygnus olor]